MHRSTKSASDRPREHANTGRAASHRDGAGSQALQRHHAPTAQRARIEAIHASPHQTVQREKIVGAFGPTVQLAAVNATNLGGVDLKPEIGADFRNNHMAASVKAAKALSRSDDRLSRTFKNTVVLDGEEAVKTALGTAPYSPTPVSVPGLNAVTIRTKTRNNSFNSKDVTRQRKVPGPTPLKIKVRLAADDDKKTSTSPNPSPTGPILVATGVSG